MGSVAPEVRSGDCQNPPLEGTANEGEEEDRQAGTRAACTSDAPGEPPDGSGDLPARYVARGTKLSSSRPRQISASSFNTPSAISLSAATTPMFMIPLQTGGKTSPSLAMRPSFSGGVYASLPPVTIALNF